MRFIVSYTAKHLFKLLKNLGFFLLEAVDVLMVISITSLFIIFSHVLSF